ncbi:MAG: thiamine diphosphokinase [Eubacterium sp.]|nr:thiamine diphosphokinase [Eubacterium sp.]
MSDRCVIISGGDFDESFRPDVDDYVIACDRGYEHARRLGVSINLVISDFDSYEGEIEDGITVERLPHVKDDTDTVAAMKRALEKGYRKIVIACALGGRMDHTIANIQTAAYGAERGAVVDIISQKERITVFKDSDITLERDDRFSLSVFSLSDTCEGVTIRGAFYELDDAVLSNTFPLGVSNEWEDDHVRIRVVRGMLAVVRSYIDG